MNTTVAKRFIEDYTGWKIDKSEQVEYYTGRLPRYLAWGPLFEEPTIEDATDSDTELTVDDDDYIYTEDGGLIDLRSSAGGTVWKITYNAGWDGIEPDTGGDDLLYNYAPEWVEEVLDALEEVDLPVEVLEEEEVPDYRYKRVLGDQILQQSPNVILLLDLNVRLV